MHWTHELARASHYQSQDGQYVLVYKHGSGYYVCGNDQTFATDISQIALFEEDTAKQLANMMPDLLHMTKEEAEVIMILQS